MNEEAEKRNRHHKATGKRRLVRFFSINEFWKYIGCILSAVKFGKKGHTLRGVNLIINIRNGPCLISRDVCGKAYLLKLSCPLYRLYYSFLYH